MTATCGLVIDTALWNAHLFCCLRQLARRAHIVLNDAWSSVVPTKLSDSGTLLPWVGAAVLLRTVAAALLS